MTEGGNERSEADVVTALAAQLGQEAFGTGPLAELRRMNPKDPAPVTPVLHRLLARHVPDSWLAGAGLNRWALLVHLLALAAPERHRGGASLGGALLAANYSEGRLTRLLAAASDELPVLLPRMVRFLVAKGERLNPFELARLALRPDSEPDRLRIARDYYRAETKASPSSAS